MNTQPLFFTDLQHWKDIAKELGYIVKQVTDAQSCTHWKAFCGMTAVGFYNDWHNGHVSGGSLR